MSGNYSKVCIHTMTTKPWSIEEACLRYAQAGIGGISVWRNTLQGRDIPATGSMLRDQGLEIISLCRGGFFPSVDRHKRSLAIQDNMRTIDEAAALGAPLIVLVCGADPLQSLETSRAQIQDGILSILQHAIASGVKLAIEPLHPMYAGDRSAINTMRQANDMAFAIDSPAVGVALDVYHVWWDSDLESEIKRCGEHDKIFAFHICDWKLDTMHMLNDRGLMGEGCIPLVKIKAWVHDAGFKGMDEVEIFSNRYWAEDQSNYLLKIKSAYIQSGL